MSRLEVRCREWTGASAGKYGHGVKRINGHNQYLHRWVWESINGPLKPGECVLHHCDNGACYLYEHLFKGSKSDNNADRHAKGRSRGPKGRKNARSKITEAQAAEIRQRYARGELQRVLGAEYGLSQCTVSTLVRGKTWTG